MNSQSKKHVDRITIVAASLVPAVAITAVLLFMTRLGYDFTDEGYYLNYIHSPSSYPGTVSFFAYLYTPIYLLLGKSIPLLRSFNIASLYGLGSIAVFNALSPSARQSLSVKYSRSAPTLFSLSFGVIALVGLGRFFTPSYNHLCLAGFLLLSSWFTSYCFLPPEERSINISSFWLGAAGLAIIAFAKPPAAAMAAICLLCFIPFTSKFKRYILLLVIALSIALYFFIGSIFAGGLTSFIAKIQLGLQWGAELGSPHNAKGILFSFLLASFWPPAFPFIGLIAVQILAFSTPKKHFLSPRIVSSIRTGLITLFLLIIAYLFFHPIHPKISRLITPQDTLLWFVALPISIFLVYRTRSRSSDNWISRQEVLAASFILFLFPFCFALGTDTGIWSKALDAAIFFLLSGIVLFGGYRPVDQVELSGRLWLILLVGIIFATTRIAFYYQNPYRQIGPIWRYSSATEIGFRPSHLRLPPAVNKYVTDLKTSLDRNGFRPGTEMLDLSGQSPGVIYALSAKSLGMPWILGGFPGSQPLANSILNSVSCTQLSQAWVLVEPGGPTSLDLELLRSREINLDDPSRYRLVAQVEVPRGVGDFAWWDKKVDKRTQYIYKPLGSAPLMSGCRANS